jgi:DUF309 family protein family protein
MNEQEQNKLLEDFIYCLNTKRYYDAHEVLETIWFPRRFEDNDEMRLLKGFINASVSFELERKNRVDASKKVWETYLKYIPLLHKIDSPHLNKYHSIAKEIEKIKK